MVRISRIFKNIALALIIILSISWVVYKSISKVVSFVADDNSSLISKAEEYSCKPIVNNGDYSRVVVLRLDDVQAFTWRDITEKIIVDTAKFNAPIVAGVIPINLSDDANLVSFMKRNQCRMEFALHGWDHSMSADNIPEFGNLSEQEADRRIKLGKKMLERVVPHQKIETFIPPNNVISDDVKTILHKENFDVLSGSVSAPGVASISIYDFSAKKMISRDEIMRDCDDNIAKANLCVIVIHPQDFIDANNNFDSASYDEYLTLLKDLQEKNSTFTTFSQLVNRNGAGLYSY